MSISGGGNRADLRPYSPAPESETLTRGSHKGAAEALNIRNPQAGFEYAWANRSHNELIRVTNDGWEVVPSDSPERKGRESDQRWSQEIDGTNTRSDVVMVRIPTEKLRALKERERDHGEFHRTGATEGFLEQGKPYSRVSRINPSGANIYRRAPGHGDSVE